MFSKLVKIVYVNKTLTITLFGVINIPLKLSRNGINKNNQ